MPPWSIRPYDGSLADARGILAVEQQTFHECPYSPEELQALLSTPQSLALVAAGEGQVVGFLSGLRTPGLDGPRLEADLLAVDPAWQGRGIATALLLALRRAAGSAGWLRGVVRPANPASEQAFAGAGFQPPGETSDLLVYRILGTVPRSPAPSAVLVHPLASRKEAAALAALAPAHLPAGERLWAASAQPGLTVVVAVHNHTVVGGVGLVVVHTLLYAGIWLEGLTAIGEVPQRVGPVQPPPDGGPVPVSAVLLLGRRRPLAALAAWAVEAAKVLGLEAVGCLVPRGDRVAREALQAEGYHKLDSYRTWAAPPLSGRAD